MNRTGINHKASLDLLAALAKRGVRDVVVCAGARNSPLVHAIEMSPGFRVASFFEERSAAFFALGRARREQRPTAVITTSGTAAAELLPATIEAFHVGVPLILVTADRPRRLRGSGAPQAIDQTGLFAKFVTLERDIEAGEEIDGALGNWHGLGPLHVNICFDEPLLDGGSKLGPSSAPVAPVETVPSDDSSLSGVDPWPCLRGFLSRVKRPVVVVGTLTSEEERHAVELFLSRTGFPVYLEGISGLRESKALQNQALRSGDRVLSWGLRRGLIDGVLRLGGVPTVRIWRDLDDPSSNVEVLSISRDRFAGLSRGEFVQSDLRLLAQEGDAAHWPSHTSAEELFRMDREASRLLCEALAQEPRSEAALIYQLSRRIPESALVYVGNSLPIREWDLSADSGRRRWIRANRGVNGIDGQTSTFYGMIPDRGEGWAILGDLTTLYDLSAPWALNSLAESRSRLVVINNGGGKIFSRIHGGALFENRHSLGFEAWARMWGLHYELWPEIPIAWEGPDHAVIEVRPDEDASTRFWNVYDAFWTAADRVDR